MENVHTSIILPGTLERKIRVVAALQGLDRSKFIRLAVERMVDRLISENPETRKVLESLEGAA